MRAEKGPGNQGLDFGTRCPWYLPGPRKPLSYYQHGAQGLDKHYRGSRMRTSEVPGPRPPQEAARLTGRVSAGEALPALVHHGLIPGAWQPCTAQPVRVAAEEEVGARPREQRSSRGSLSP